jgi:hypothetical protein
MPASKPKPRRPGHPRLVRAEVRGNVVPVRFKNEDLKRIIAAARAKDQTVSQWVRSKLLATTTTGVQRP